MLQWAQGGRWVEHWGRGWDGGWGGHRDRGWGRMELIRNWLSRGKDPLPVLYLT